MARTVGQHHGDLRRALLGAALALVGEVAVDAVTLREVARRAGVSASACYHHFPDRDTLFAEVAREGFAALAAVQAAVRSRRPAQRLADMTAAYVRFALAHHTHYRVMFRASPDDVRGGGAEVLRETARATFDTLVGVIATVRPTASRRRQMELALLAWAHAHGAVDVARWAHGLDPRFDGDAFAAQVGRTVATMVVAAVPAMRR